MWGDEYLYQQLGYKHIYRKLKDVTEGEILDKVIHISKLTLTTPTEKEVEEYNSFRKVNYDMQVRRGDSITRLIMLVGLVVFVVYSVAILIFSILISNIIVFFMGSFLSLISIAALISKISSLKKKTHMERPAGVICGYLVSAYTDVVTKRVGYKPYHTVTEHNTYLDIWLEEEDRYLRKVLPSLKEFRYDGKTFCWSDLAYTPVKVFVFSEYRLEVMPAYAELKK